MEFDAEKLLRVIATGNVDPSTAAAVARDVLHRPAFRLTIINEQDCPPEFAVETGDVGVSGWHQENGVRIVDALIQKTVGMAKQRGYVPETFTLRSVREAPERILRILQQTTGGRCSEPHAPELPLIEHSADYRSVRWGSEAFIFSAMQAACVRILHEAAKNGTPDLSIAAILEQADSSSQRLSVVFRGHPAWKTLIVESRKGVYRLAENPPRTEKRP